MINFSLNFDLFNNYYYFYERLLVILVSLVPTLILVGFVLYSDRKSKEPTKNIVICLLSGILTIALSGYFEQLIMPYFASNVFLSYAWAFIEELSKMLIFFLFIFDNKYYDDIYDGVVYMMLIALSFAGLENLMYAFSESTVSSSISLALMRDVTTIPLHVICGIVIGYFVSLGTFSKDKMKKIINFLMALLLSSFIHGTFNNIMELLGSIGQTSALVAILLEVLPLTLIMIGLFAITIIFSKRTMYLNKIYLSNGTYDDKHKYLMTYDEYLISNDRKKRVKLYNKTNFKGNKNDNDVEVLKEDL